MKVNEEIREILEAFDLTQSNEAAARLAGCDPKTVARYVAARDCGNDPVIAVTRDRRLNDREHRQKRLTPEQKWQIFLEIRVA